MGHLDPMGLRACKMGPSRSCIEQSQPEIVVQVAAKMDREAELGWTGRVALAEHYQFQLLHRRASHLAAQALQRFQEEIRPLTGIGTSTNGTKYNQPRPKASLNQSDLYWTTDRDTKDVYITENTGNGNSFDNRPAYYALAYIMKL